ncbi:peptidyl-prolyl cis-trans isomerase CYP26-2, chloroplastic [Punica granatum]|uniref:Peptidyl-prolyl cis-trans isomerase CYP26-2, chloroplastic n=1 Tax=Punica granatum TaxID=22663 RepID=A0A6P8BNF7_PUNGR|nr:peptidyl-prolyl cis-trans isomerase CYP26-2, chloroplastic [Punica granatum]
MLQNSRLLQSSPQHFHNPPKLPSQAQTLPDPSANPAFKPVKFSRRELALCANSSLLLLLGSHSFANPSKALAEETQGAKSSSPAQSCSDKQPTKRAFLDISIDGEPAGRIVIGLYGDDSPAGAARFSNLVSGAAGISYRRKEFVKIMPNYVQHSGVRSYGVDVELASRTGSDLTNQNLTEEWEREFEKCPGTKNLAGTVGIIVRNPSKPPPNLKLVARQGKLEIDQEEVVKDPNATEFVISIKDSPELDASTLVIGTVLEGMEVVKRIGEVKTVNENTSSPYFRVAKLIGDKRAVVAERGFNRPYSKVLVTNCGLVE